jgi:trimethylamine--corrinoid protein Co-methyltransferase
MRDEIYGIPIWAFAGASDSKVMDAQAGAEAMFSILTAMQSRCNVIHDVGYLESGSTSSLEMITMADELVAMSRFLTAGIPVNTDTLALDVIGKVSKGDENFFFLKEDHTFKNFRKAQFLPRLLDRSQHEVWKKSGSRELYHRCNAKAKEILTRDQVSPKSEHILGEIEQIIEPQRRMLAN